MVQGSKKAAKHVKDTIINRMVLSARPERFKDTLTLIKAPIADPIASISPAIHATWLCHAKMTSATRLKMPVHNVFRALPLSLIHI